MAAHPLCFIPEPSRLGLVGAPGEQLCGWAARRGDNADVDYDLNRLGFREFEHLIQALALKHLGNGIQVFGDGPDGGREAVFDGPLTFPVGTGDATWDGYGIVQAKHRMRPEGPGRDADWLINDSVRSSSSGGPPTPNVKSTAGCRSTSCS